MEQETAQGNIPVAESTVPLEIVQEHLGKTTAALKENTVALVEMGITIRGLENKIAQLLNIFTKK